MTTMVEKPWDGWRIARWSVAAILLLIPAVMMQIDSGWNWSVGDFVFAGFMIVGTALLFELAVKLSGSFAYRAGAAVGLLTGFLLIWITLAVGIIGSENDVHNAFYVCEVLLAAAAAFAAALKPAGMMRAMLAAAAFQALITAAAFAGNWGANEPPGAFGVLALNGAFAGLWLLSAALFGKAARIEAGAG